MTRELDSEMLGRLQLQYEEFSDGELLGMARRPDELTAVAQEALRRELVARGLAARPESRTVADDGSLEEDPWINSAAPPTTGDLEDAELGMMEGSGARQNEVSLRVFYDALEAGGACRCLEEQQISFRLKDVSEEMKARDPGYATVALSLMVDKSDRTRAMTVLRERLGLFPLQEVEVADEMVDDGTVVSVGCFGAREDAEEVARLLGGAGIGHQVAANPEGTAEDENAWDVEVREIDLVRAGDVVERAMGLEGE